MKSHHSCNLSLAPSALLAYFFPASVLFPTENAKGTTLSMPCHAMPSQKIDMPNKNNKYTNQSNKYTISIKRVRQPKLQVRHFNQKNTPSKTPSTPSQYKEYANKNTKYAISTKRIRQPKHQVLHLNQKNTPM